MFGSSPIEVLAREAMRAGWIYCEQFTYTARFLASTATAIAANGEQTVPILISNGWDFIIQEYAGSWYNANAALNASPLALVNFTKDTADKKLSSAPVAWANVFGCYDVNKVPNKLSYPVLLSEKSTFQVNIVNLTADAPARVETAYPGFKVYYKEKNGRQVTRQELFGVTY